MKKYILISGIILAAFAAYCFNYYHLGNPRLIIHNNSKVRIDSIVVEVTGNSYMIDHISQGEERMIRVDPVSDSHIKLLLNNRKDILIIDTYLDRSSTGGYIEVWITEDRLTAFDHKRGIL